ncbi:hypothetical protein CK203_030045 [Vitis vinifera]|uniref:PHD-type zinc finger plants domain-containing protein n=1 Tax=Vitis vinifera TaxID=29760 RepID=A0A438IK56_VITVI|nr:hypothetical protein CK203_030045 [Vitis vinifera]
MVDFQTATVCCMCGDVGFSDKLFRCHKCRNRFQHSYGLIIPSSSYHHMHFRIHHDHVMGSYVAGGGWMNCIHGYCSNYYSESSERMEVCDWCQTEERSATRHGSSSKKSVGGLEAGVTSRSEYSGDKIKQHDREESGEKGKNLAGRRRPGPPLEGTSFSRM